MTKNEKTTMKPNDDFRLAKVLTEGHGMDDLTCEIHSAAYGFVTATRELMRQMESVKGRAERAIAGLQRVLDHCATEDLPPMNIQINTLGEFQSSTVEADRLTGLLEARRVHLSTLVRLQRRMEKAAEKKED